MNLKNSVRSFLNFLHLDITQNLEYDRLTKAIMKKVIKENSNCIDVGCHKGEMLEIILALSPGGNHYAFEPIPGLYKYLTEAFKGKATVYPYALSDKNGTSTFQFVKNAPAYSGIHKRKYAVKTADIEEIKVELKRLDELIPSNEKIDFIKIDVEGAEFAVMKGGAELLKKNKPVVIFECGLGSSEYYDTKPGELYNFLADIGLKISSLKSYIKNEKNLSQEEFINCFNTNQEYYFAAHP